MVDPGYITEQSSNSSKAAALWTEATSTRGLATLSLFDLCCHRRAEHSCSGGFLVTSTSSTLQTWLSWCHFFSSCCFFPLYCFVESCRYLIRKQNLRRFQSLCPRRICYNQWQTVEDHQQTALWGVCDPLAVHFHLPRCGDVLF